MWLHSLSELKISYVVYEQQLIQVQGDDDDIIVALKEENHDIDEVVVVGLKVPAQRASTSHRNTSPCQSDVSPILWKHKSV